MESKFNWGGAVVFKIPHAPIDTRYGRLVALPESSGRREKMGRLNIPRVPAAQPAIPQNTSFRDDQGHTNPPVHSEAPLANLDRTETPSAGDAKSMIKLYATLAAHQASD